MALVRAIREYAVLVALLILFVTLTVISDNFLSTTNLLNVARQASITGIIAFAMTYVLIAGGFDLSVGSVFALGGSLAAGLSADMPVAAAFALTVLAGAAIGAVNGMVITRFRINAFVATLGTLQIVRGGALLYTDAKPLTPTDSSFTWIGQGDVAGVPVPVLLLVGLMVIAHLVLSRTRYGRYVYSIGSNDEASRLAGLPVDRLRASTYVLSGAAAALAGIVFASRIGVGQADVGSGLELSVIAAVLVGGTSLLGGEGSVWRTAAGVAFFALIFNGFNLLNVQAFWQNITSGAVILLAVGMDTFLRERRS